MQKITQDYFDSEPEEKIDPMQGIDSEPDYSDPEPPAPDHEDGANPAPDKDAGAGLTPLDVHVTDGEELLGQTPDDADEKNEDADSVNRSSGASIIATPDPQPEQPDSADKRFVKRSDESESPNDLPTTIDEEWLSDGKESEPTLMSCSR